MSLVTLHHWGRELGKLGHTVRLMPPAYVKAYVKRGKTDAADAEAICEAVTRPTMRFVAVKSMEQQGVLMLHKTRDLLVRQRTMLINALRGHIPCTIWYPRLCCVDVARARPSAPLNFGRVLRGRLRGGLAPCGSRSRPIRSLPSSRRYD
ncbi:hypothetical protein AB7M37_004724 [Sinorhizobium fredii]